MSSFSYIHSADLHLDTPFTGIGERDPVLGKRLKEATFDSFDSLIELCVGKKIDFLLIAGDIYDNRNQSIRARLAFRDGMIRLKKAGVEVFAVCGNHDPLEYRSSIKLPDNVHLFGHENVTPYIYKTYNGEEVAISGISYKKKFTSDNLVHRFPPPVRGIFNIGLLHCTLGGMKSDKAHAPCSLDDLKASGHDYWALGHIHERRVVCKTPFVIYPGNIQGRSIKETGPRGCYHILVEDRRIVTYDFHPLDTVRWHSLTVNCQGIEDIGELKKSILEKIESTVNNDEDRGSICRIVLEGKTGLFSELSDGQSLSGLEESVRQSLVDREDFTLLQGVENRLGLHIDLNQRSKEKDFTGELLRTAETVKKSSDFNEIKELFKKLYNLKELSGIVKMPHDNEIAEMVDSAAMLCVDLLDRNKNQ